MNSRHEQFLKDFPILQSTMRGKPFIYLDSGATSLTPRQVVDRLNRYYLDYGVNIHRGVYEFSERATLEYEQTRDKLSSFLGIPKPQSNTSPMGHVIFTKSTTESANLIAYSWGRVNLKPGDEILTTELEHHSTLVPWHPVTEKTGAVLKFVPISQMGTYTLEDFTSQLTGKTKLVVFSAMSNVTGFIPPVKEMINAARAAGAVTVVDGAQYVSHHRVNIQDLNPDFLYFSAHKMLGPTGLGVLYGRTPLLESMEPFLYGGDMILRVGKYASTYHPLPQKFEAGTPHIAGVIGFSAALDYLNDLGMDAIRNREKELLTYALKKAREFQNIQLFGPGDPEHQGAILSFNLPGIHSHDVGTLLDTQGVAVRTGVHCAQPLMEHLGIGGTVRASMYFYNTFEDIDALFSGLTRAQEIFG